MEIANRLEFIDADKRYNLTRVAPDEITIEEVDAIWDGPLAGDCKWKNGLYYFFSFDQLVDDASNEQWPNKYILIDLSSGQREELIKWRKSQRGTLTINPQQLVGWFEAKDRKGKRSKFLESYFSFKKH